MEEALKLTDIAEHLFEQTANLVGFEKLLKQRFVADTNRTESVVIRRSSYQTMN